MQVAFVVCLSITVIWLLIDKVLNSWKRREQNKFDYLSRGEVRTLLPLEEVLASEEDISRS